ncbi:MAG: sulfotransferase domain-containing protein, partial [Gemmatimonadota bacterium]|nr:sulfotransferase domain-containing protein [Gemmatimonadota bacterium]
MPEREGCLPNLLVIGAMNAGTTSLYHYLRLHPEIHMSTPKELTFFADEWNWPRGLDWYASHFDPSFAVNGEASPLYTTYPECPEIAERIGRNLPDVKLLYLVRDPIARMISQYVTWTSSSRENR